MKKETEEWLKIAHEDFEAAQHLSKENLYRMVCYHSQQAVEKILKAILTEKEIDFAKTYNLLDLRNALTRLGCKVELSDEDAAFLNSIYRPRYPSDLGLLPGGEPTNIDAEKALNIAGKLLEYTKTTGWFT